MLSISVAATNIRALRSLRACSRTLATRKATFRQEALKLRAEPPKAGVPDVLKEPTSKAPLLRPKSDDDLIPSFKAAAERSCDPLRKLDEEAEAFLTRASCSLEEGGNSTRVNWDAAMKVVREAERRFPIR